MADKKEISRATGIMGIATSLSRVAGLIRDVIVANLFGAGFATDAFFMAFTIPNLLRRFFAEGSLTAAFVPIFSEVHHGQGEREAQKVANICWTLLLLVMTGVVAVGIIGSPWVVKGIGFGFGGVPGKLELTDYLNRLMFPYIFFISLLALLTGVMNVRGHYFLPSLSPLVLNLAMILCALVLGPFFSTPVVSLAVGVLLGGALQLLMQFPMLRRMGIRLSLDFDFKHPAVVRISRLMLPGIAGVAIYQINVIVTRLMASFLPEGSVSYLYYAQRLFEFPQGIFIVSLAQAVLPSMSRQAAVGDMPALKESLRFSLVLLLLVILPASIGLALCAVPVFSLFFMSSRFSFSDVQQTGYALAAYAPGLLFAGISRVVVPTFFALKDTRTPVMISFWTLLVNAVLGLALMGPLQHTGLALAVTLSSVFNCLVLVWALRRKIGRLGLQSLGISLLKILPGACAMTLVVYHLLGYGPWDEQGQRLLKGAVLAVSVGAGALLYGGVCLVMRVEEVTEVVDIFKRKVLRKRG